MADTQSMMVIRRRAGSMYRPNEQSEEMKAQVDNTVGLTGTRGNFRVAAAIEAMRGTRTGVKRCE